MRQPTLLGQEGSRKMSFQFVESVLPELLEVERVMEQAFQLRAGHVSRFVSLELARVDKYLYPAMLLLVARMFGAGGEKGRPLAAVVQFIRLATHVHRYDGKAPQYPVLVGDYLYSHFFFYLSKHDYLEMLAPLSASICQIHEGGIIRKEVLETGNGGLEDYAAVAEKEWGSLLAESCAIGAKIAGAAHEMVEAVHAYGRNFGTAWGILRSGFTKPSPDHYLCRAREALETLPDTPERHLLALAVGALVDEPEAMKKFMAG